MKYCSTRNSNIEIRASEAILNGICDDGGLYVPKEFPKVNNDFLLSLASMSYVDRAKSVLSLFLSDFTADELNECVSKAYSDSFEDNNPAQVVKLGDSEYVMELWHGPTCAFKDVALQLLPHVLVKSAEKNNANDKIVILTATSGDTGKAALEGFADVEGTEIGVFFPNSGVSNIQKLQMQTQKGSNVFVCGIEGNFDDAQSAVKSIFVDDNIKKAIKEKGKRFSSANSINLGRLVPQVVYYFSGYADLLKEKEINAGDKINFVVPTGNFGNILSAYYANKMGLPINRLICASNRNNILTDFINSGTYDTNREFYLTESPSMDILISSNLERLLYDCSDDKSVISYMSCLKGKGKFSVSDSVKKSINNLFYADFCDDTETEDTIKKYNDEFSYTSDTHTAVALNVYGKYLEKTNDYTKTVIVSTASPYKFPSAVLRAVSNETVEDDFSAAEKLENLIKLNMPNQLKELKNKEVKYTDFISKNDIKEYVLNMVGGAN